MNGIVKRLVQDKGYGFLQDEATKVEHFFHRSAVKTAGGFENLKEGQHVDFDEVSSSKGPRAENIR